MTDGQYLAFIISYGHHVGRPVAKCQSDFVEINDLSLIHI